MATIDLGKIKMVWRGAYDNATAYTPDDVVSSGGSSYICILASTGNAVSNATYWSLLAQGGTDVGTTLTTQGDILYRDGSGLQRLAPGTANQVLKTGGAGANPSWGTLSSDFVKIAAGSHSGTALELDNIFTADYTRYKVYLHASTMPGYLNFQLRSGGASGTTSTASEYRYVTEMWYRNTSSRGETGEHAWNDDKMRIGWQGSNTTDKRCNIEMFVDNPYANDMKFLCGGLHHQYQQDNVTIAMFSGANDTAASTRWTGLRFYDSGNNSFVAEYGVYGLKS